MLDGNPISRPTLSSTSTTSAPWKPRILAAIQHMLEVFDYPALPNLSNSTGIAKLRYIQSIYERLGYRNPDTLVGDLLPPPVRWLSSLQGKLRLSKLRSRPFYFYLIARTRHYDQVFIEAMQGNIETIINIGCGADTRAYRFAAELVKRQKKVLECDQKHLISVKKRLSEKQWSINHVTYISVDMNDDCWPELESALGRIHTPVLLIMEGVSPYVCEDAFDRFLSFIAAKTCPGSRVAYDYKICATAGDVEKLGRTKRPFRLPVTKMDIASYHEALGYKLERMELGAELMSRLLPNLRSAEVFAFTEDCLLELTVAQSAKTARR
jgi:methyltransferase (TIGR00027 family)